MKCGKCSLKEECPYVFLDEINNFTNCPILDMQLFYPTYKNIDQEDEEVKE